MLGRINAVNLKDLEKALAIYNRHSSKDDLPLKKIGKKILGVKPSSKITYDELLLLLDNPQQKFFVYGTLMPHEKNHHLVASIEGKWYTAITYGYKRPVIYGRQEYQGLEYDSKGGMVFGYVLNSSVLDELWTEFDEFEGEKYIRNFVPVWINGEINVATSYVINSLS